MRIEAVGYVLAQWDYATLCMKIRGRGKCGPDAKQHVKEPSKRVHKVLTQFGITEQKKKSTFNLREETNYNRSSDEHEVIGYRATNHITIYVQELNKLGDLQDALTSIEGVEVESPALRISPEHKAQLQEQALAKAWDKAQRRWAHECKILDLAPEDYWPGNFTTSYNRNNRGDVGGEVSSVDDALQINAGAALVSVELSLNYYRKKLHKPNSGPYADNSPCFCVDCGLLSDEAVRPVWENNVCRR